MISRRLQHFDGARCLASTWIICNNFMPLDPPGGMLGPARHRGSTAVGFFVLLSGFFTHGAYGGLQPVSQYYSCRLSRVLLTTLVAALVGVLVLLVHLNGMLPGTVNLVRCYTFSEPWTLERDRCFNGQTWSWTWLLPSWLAYPLTRKGLLWLEEHCGRKALATCGMVLWLFTVALALAGLWESVSGRTFVYLATYVCDFAIGCVIAELANQDDVPSSQKDIGETGGLGQASQQVPAGAPSYFGHWRGVLADSSALAVLLLCAFSPLEALGASGSLEPVLVRLVALLYAVFVFCLSCGSEGFVASFLRHDALASLGGYSFAVLMFQWPLHEVFASLGDMAFAKIRRNDNAEGFFLYFLTLWLSAGLYVDCLESPVLMPAWRKKSANALEVLTARTFSREEEPPALPAENDDSEALLLVRNAAHGKTDFEAISASGASGV